jgi:DNA transposition AAA+ family ATPase
MNNGSDVLFIETKEYRRFAEFCDACRRYRYIGLCYGPPGVGKTLSARHYANWDKVETYGYEKRADNGAYLDEVLGSHVVLYTPAVVNSPRQLEGDIGRLRQNLRSIPLDELYRIEEPLREEARIRKKREQWEYFLTADWLCGNEAFHESEPTIPQIAQMYSEKRRNTKDPTDLIVIDEADRLRMAGLDQVRDIFDKSGVGLVLIGMPGLEKRLARYPQLYSRVGFVHEFRPLAQAETRQLLQQIWKPSSVPLPDSGLDSEEVMAGIARVTGGNFRLLHRLLTQMGRIVEINRLTQITLQVVEAARESLVIGAA